MWQEVLYILIYGTIFSLSTHLISGIGICLTYETSALSSGNTPHNTFSYPPDNCLFSLLFRIEMP